MVFRSSVTCDYMVLSWKSNLSFSVYILRFFEKGSLTKMFQLLLRIFCFENVTIFCFPSFCYIYQETGAKIRVQCTKAGTGEKVKHQIDRFLLNIFNGLRECYNVIPFLCVRARATHACTHKPQNYDIKRIYGLETSPLYLE